MSQSFVGQIAVFGFSFAPQNWAFCDGRLLAISSNTALFALLGTTYGGNGVQTFALPDLRGRVPLSFGNGTGLSPYVIGQTGGTEQTSLALSNVPTHSHTATLQVGSGGRAVAPTANNYLETTTTVAPSPSPTLIALNPANITVGPAGNGLPFPALQPYLAVNFCICLFGIFPSRN